VCIRFCITVFALMFLFSCVYNPKSFFVFFSLKKLSYYYATVCSHKTASPAADMSSTYGTLITIFASLNRLFTVRSSVRRLRMHPGIACSQPAGVRSCVRTYVIE